MKDDHNSISTRQQIVHRRSKYFGVAFTTRRVPLVLRRAITVIDRALYTQ